MMMTKLKPVMIGLIGVIVSFAAESKSNTLGMAQERIFTFESDASGFNTKTYFYDNGEEVVAIDTQFTTEHARKSIAYLRTQTQNPISYAIITHPNPDKFNGLRVFQEHGAKVIASSETARQMPGVHAYKKHFFVEIAKMFSEQTYPALGIPDLVFDDSLRLKLNNGNYILLNKLPYSGVSATQTVAFIPSLNVLFVGDLAHHNAHAWLEGGIVGNIG